MASPADAPVPGIFLLQYPLKFCAIVTGLTWILSVATGNVSQVDRLWTFLPTLYTAYFALLPLWPRREAGWLWWGPTLHPAAQGPTVDEFSSRALLMLSLTVLWMLRLSYNTWRRGLFNLHDEDYRWAVLRKKVHWVVFQLINLTFIAGIQNVLLLLIALPTLRAVRLGPTPLHTSDYALAVTALALLAWEFTADNQQFAFHAWKAGTYAPQEHWPGARLAWTETDRRRGFITRGLWAWSRHPNFFAEQSFWVRLFPMANSRIAADPDLHQCVLTLMPSAQTFARLLPAVSLCLLFAASTRFTESISASKYPEAYKAYQRRVSKFVPWLTPVWGAWLRLRGREERERVETLVWGQEVRAKVE
ncbi:hypothetical protein K488DRAFT_57136 [Vararia minispora EC-137]|uniref:Uncharacterized protein n=1 Tax=Vararia minispora EC-137 TaxID=1314806 RepID=A0ACB8QBJ2_9AGAM|nr:hypothetical protein K488DRAFT_57136 [Vararia minispora EC-137]